MATPDESLSDRAGARPTPKRQAAKVAEEPSGSAGPRKKRDAPRDAPGDAPRDAPRDASRDAPRDAPREGRRERPEARALPEDPERPGNSWCGICRVSLSPTKAKGHLETARHQANGSKALKTAIRAPKT